MGFFTDYYDLFSISIVTKLLGCLCYTLNNSDVPGVLPLNISAAVTGVALCSTLARQLFYGSLSDKMSKKKVYDITLMLMVLCHIALWLSFGSGAKGVMATLCFFRFWLGFGIGGDYPLSAMIMSYYCNKKTHGAFVAAVFAMEGFGILAGGIVVLIVSALFDQKYNLPTYQENPKGSVVPELDYMWGIILMFPLYSWLLLAYEDARN